MKNIVKIKKEHTGIINDGFEIIRYILSNNNGISVEIISQGCAITKFIAPDRNNNFDNIVLAYPNISYYIDNIDCFGAIVGRTAGRISNATFVIDENKYTLNPNEYNNLLHGGESAFHLKNWSSEEFTLGDSVGVKFTHISPDGEAGYPANVKTEVVYLLDNNCLDMKITATADKKTVYDVANHSYFNLNQSGEDDILEHGLYIDGSHFVPVNSSGCPMGLIAGVDGTSFDFRNKIKIINAVDINEIQIKRRNGIDHPILLNENKSPQIMLYNETVGRKISIWTDRQSAVVYTGNHIKYRGICFETQSIPDAINHRGFDFELLTPTKPYYSNTKYYVDVL